MFIVPTYPLTHDEFKFPFPYNVLYFNSLRRSANELAQGVEQTFQTKAAGAATPAFLASRYPQIRKNRLDRGTEETSLLVSRLI